MMGMLTMVHSEITGECRKACPLVVNRSTSCFRNVLYFDGKGRSLTCNWAVTNLHLSFSFPLSSCSFILLLLHFHLLFSLFCCKQKPKRVPHPLLFFDLSFLIVDFDKCISHVSVKAKIKKKSWTGLSCACV